MAVKHDRDRPPVADDPGHVGGGREAADLDRAVTVSDELFLQVLLIDVAVVVLADDDHVRDRLPPGKLVGVVLVRADEDDRAFCRRDQRREVVAIVEVSGYAHVEDVDQAVDGAGRT